MIQGTRKSGIDVIGHVPWGTHFGLFYKTKQDLHDFLVPYFEAGLKNNEFCMWVTAEPLNAEEAKACMAEALPDFDVYMDKGQIEIIPYTEWYTIDDVFDPERVLNGWVEKLRKARERGFSGLRLTGNESWLESNVWKDFIDYEQTINDVIGQYNMLAVCSYPQDKCDANDILEVVSTHQFILTRRNGDWKIIEDQGQKKARKALQESEAELARAQRISHIGSWTWDLMTDEVTWSDESYRNYGLVPGEVKPTYENFLSFIVPDDRERVDKEVRRAIETGDKYNVIYKIIRKDGTPRILLSENEVITDSSGKVIRMYGTNQDITESKQVVEELKAAKQQAELYLDLMGHDINNMHQIALGYLELAKDSQADHEPTIFLDKPIEVLQRSAKLINNVRKLQKLQDGMFQDQDVEVCKVLSNVQREFGAMPDKTVMLNLNGWGQCHVRANELLHDVFSNLVSNAIKHTNDRVDIIIDMDIIKDNGRNCRVMVEDYGPGIPDDFKGAIFNRTLKGSANAKGMGLGLYLVKSLVDSYGGQVWVEDRIMGDHAKGARFVVMLPAVEK